MKIKKSISKVISSGRNFIGDIAIKVKGSDVSDLEKDNFFTFYKTFDEFKNRKSDLKRKEIEKEIEWDKENDSIEAHCLVCNRKTKMKKDYFGNDTLNLRETFLCNKCGLNNRLRASYFLLERIIPDFRKAKIYITEELTPLYDLLSRQARQTVGSEFFPNSNERKVFFSKANRYINNEDLTNLSFENNSLDIVLSFEVFEHIPDYKKALSEIYRVLNENGHFIFTIPFVSDAEKTLIRAKISDGEIENILSPEYHGDPVNSTDGCLCFYHFGWDILEELKKIGFKETNVVTYWSDKCGHLGDGIILYAKK